MKPKPSRPNRKRHSRRTYIRELVQKFLIVCEGKQTEPIYFRSFHVPGDIKHIKIYPSGRNTLSLVYETIKLKTKDNYDQVWCVFDVEDYTPEDIHSAMQLAKSHQINIACSNQAFEIWFLLHYHYYNNALDRSQYSDLLSKLLGFPYEKNLDISHLLSDKQPLAIKNAERLLREYPLYDPATCNPSTSVHRLVIELNRFSPDSRVNSEN
jgi:Fe-S-cluster formation regulator IscX/YfhJ